MIKNKIKKIIYIFLCTYSGLSFTERILTFQLEYYPLDQEKESSKQYVKNLSNAGQLPKNGIQNTLEQHNGGVVSGIFCSYGGFLTTSDIDGQITFPLLQTTPQFHILITTRVVPILLKRNTIHHWEIEEGTPARVFIVTKKQDEGANLYYWDMQETNLASTLTNEREIPVDTITIYARPKDIYIPTGITPTIDSPNMVLPTLYIRKNSHLLENAFHIMNLNYLFRNVNFKYKESSKGFAKLVTYP